MPIRLVDGAMETVRELADRDELFAVLGEIEEFYGHPDEWDGEESPEDYGEAYFKRWNQDFTDWHIGHTRNLIERTHCRSALDVGCGMGNMVRGFLRNGVDAWGVEISRYAVENCDEEIRGRVLWGDLTRVETLPQRRFDLVLAYDLVEHVPKPEIAVPNLCGLSGRWIHVKAPDIRGLDKEECRRFDSTHITGRSIRWWIERIEECGFSLVLDYDYTLLKWDPEYGLSSVGAPDLHGLFKRKVMYR